MKRLLWIVEKEFDIAPDVTTWIEVARALQDKLDVFIITGFNRNRKQFSQLRNEVIYLDSIKIPYFNRFSTHLTQLRNIKTLISRFSPDIVLLNTSNFFLSLRLKALSRIHRFRVFLDVRTLPLASNELNLFMENQLFKTNLRIASDRLDGISYITEEMKRYCKKTFCLSSHYSGTWSSGVNIQLFKPAHAFRYNETLQLIYHGSISVNRGLEELVETIAICRQNNINVNLTFLGGGNAVERLKQKVDNHNLTQAIFFLGQVPQEQVPSYIANADLGVIPLPNRPSWNTSSPIKLFEYLASGKPVILTKIPAHTNVIGGRSFAFWVDDTTPTAIAKTINEVSKQRGRLPLLQDVARVFAVENCSWEKQADRLFRFLTEVRDDPLRNTVIGDAEDTLVE